MNQLTLKELQAEYADCISCLKTMIEEKADKKLITAMWKECADLVIEINARSNTNKTA